VRCGWPGNRPREFSQSWRWRYARRWADCCTTGSGLGRWRSSIGGFAALKPRPRSDRNRSRVLAEDLQQLVLDMKREDPGRSAHLILRELELAGRIVTGQASVSSVQRLLHRHGLSVPRMELGHAARYRWEASMCGELWQADALHGPLLMNPATGRTQRVIVFGLIDDRSRPGDAPSKGKIERVWRTLRGQLIERLDRERVTTTDEFNLRLWTWVESEYHHQPHASLSGCTPLEVWESDADQIRWVEDHSQLEQNFYGEVERLVRNDSTVQWRGHFYEVPPYMRRQRVHLRYALLDATCLRSRWWNRDSPAPRPACR